MAFAREQANCVPKGGLRLSGPYHEEYPERRNTWGGLLEERQIGRFSLPPSEHRIRDGVLHPLENLESPLVLCRTCPLNTSLQSP